MYKDINLLYPEEKRKKGIGPQLGFIVLLLVILVIIFAAFFFYTYTINNRADEYIDDRASTQKAIDTLSQQDDSFLRDLKYKNDTLSYIIRYESSKVSDSYWMLVLISKMMPEGVELRNINYDKKSNIYCEGTSKSTEAIAVFSNNLKTSQVIRDTKISTINLNNSEETKLYNFSIEILLGRGDN